MVERRIEPEAPGRAARRELRLGANLRRADVGLVERIHAERRAHDGRGELPAEELAAERLRRWREAHHRAMRSLERRRQRGVRSGVGRGDRDEHAIVRVLGDRASRFIDDRQHPTSVFARAFRDQLFDPGAERTPRRWQEQGQLVASGRARVRRRRRRAPGRGSPPNPPGTRPPSRGRSRASTAGSRPTSAAGTSPNSDRTE